MIPLDNLEKWSTRLDEQAARYLSPREFQEYAAISGSERSRQVRALLERPIAHFTIVNEVYFRARWAEALRAVHPQPGLVLLEVASGDADMIPQMMARDFPHSRYLAANTNQKLTASLRAKTRAIPVDVAVIEGDAAGVGRHLAPESVDVVAFQHGVNDVLQAILCDQAGVDTTHADWMETLPRMIELVQREIDRNTFEQNVKPAFLALLDQLLKVLKPGGLIVMSHYMFQLDLDWGYPPALWENLIPIVRTWTEDIPVAGEASVEGFAPQWWLFLRK